MCTNCKWVYNKYIRQSVLVKCGHCPACIQEKACHRASRIRNNIKSGELCLFVTLTYDNNSVPYIWRSDVDSKQSTLRVFRDISTRRNRRGRGYTFVDDRKYQTELLDSFRIGEYPDDFDSTKLMDLNKKFGRIGVCYYPDLQKFFKRLRINLKRHLLHGKYSDDFRLSFFACSEYGSTSQRPHFHLLIFIKREFEHVLRSAIVASWPFADKHRTKKYIELARDAASYVASYVNSNSKFSSLLETKFFKQKHSYSQHFGFALNAFQLSSILEQSERRTLLYTREQVKDGIRTLIDIPIPKYVINRYFPRYKGFNRVSCDETFRVATNRRGIIYESNQYLENNLFERPTLSPFKALVNGSEITYYKNIEPTDFDTHKFLVRMRHAVDYYISVTGKTPLDYALDYHRIWNLYESQKLILSYKSELEKGVNCWHDYYDNIYEVLQSREYCYNGYLHGDVLHSDIAPTLSYIHVDDFNLNPNANSERVEKTAHFTELYYKLSKQKDVTNRIMVEQGHYV